ncbi:MAG: hypothetical protein ACLFWD_03005 [Anaerolineales bacterium]
MNFRLDQVVDWRAVFLAGTISALVFLLANLILNTLYLGSFWLTWRILASVALGADVIPPLEGGQGRILLTALFVHIPLSVLFTALIAIVVHEYGIWASAIAGGLLGAAIYLINFYGLAFLFPWLTSLTSWLMLASHVAFGFVAGGIYEILERDIYRMESVDA